MMTMEQTITISADHQIILDLPPELPVGKTRVEMTFTSLADVHKTKENKRIRLTKSMVDEMLQDEALLSLTGLLHTNMTAEEIHAERLRKYDHTN